MELRFYQTAERRRPFEEWLGGLRDIQAMARVQARLARIATGNFGDCAAVGAGVMEMRIDWGPGYRVYFARLGQVVILLLCGGDKKTQQRDIQDARKYFEDYKARTARPGTRRPG